MQLVGLLESYGRQLPIAIFFAFHPTDVRPESPLMLEGLWVEEDPSRPYLQDALLDLLLEKGQFRPREMGTRRSPGTCPVCGKETAGGRFYTHEGLPLCPRHMGEQWERNLSPWVSGRSHKSCTCCKRASALLWLRPQGSICTRCLADRVMEVPGVLRWVLFQEPPLEGGRRLDLALFLEAWRLVSRCSRCGSRRIRIRKVSWEFPRALGPILPLWESTHKESPYHVESDRQRQLEIYTHGMLKASVECPQCGYSVREFLGRDVRLRGHPALGEAWPGHDEGYPPCEGPAGPPWASPAKGPKPS